MCQREIRSQFQYLAMSVPTPTSGLRATLAEIAEPGRLADVWAQVLASDLDDGVLGAGVSRFAENADQNLAEIATRLLARNYEPGQLTPVSLPRPDGQMRVLHVPTVRDRVVERSVLAVVTPVIDPWLGPFSYAYRPGLGVADASQAIATLRDEGLGWVARADFHDCFGTIPLSRLRRVLSILIEDAALLELIEAFLARQSVPHSGRSSELKGLPQGGLCSAEHNEPYEQCRVMRSDGLPGLVRAGCGAEHCA
jgi:retron-type reverse transcriptase